MIAARAACGAAGCAAALLTVACTGHITLEDSAGVPGAGSSAVDRDGAAGSDPDEMSTLDGGERPDEGTGPTPFVCNDLGIVGAPVPMRRLNASQVERTVAEVLGVSAKLEVTDERILTYRSNTSTSIDPASARSYLDFAETVIAQADLSRCDTESCLPWLLDEIGPRLFRRPLDDEQRERYTTLYQLGEGPRWVLEAMVQSPTFLYVDEVIGSDGYLDDYSIAARMAFVLWGSNPDDALLVRAREGGLAMPTDIREEAERMLEDPRSIGGLRDFVDQWLDLQRLDEADTRPDLAALGADTVSALRDEPVQLFRTLLEEGGNFSDLLTTSETVRIDVLEPTYSSDIVEMSATRYALDPMRRAGILALPGVMAALSHAQATSPTLRGFAVLSNFLCTPPPPPPAGVNVTLPEVGPDATSRERLEAHFSDDTCGSCHRTMDGIGFAFESIDWLGRSRDEEHGQPIDDLSTFALDGDEITVDGLVELAEVMAQSDAVAECVAKQWTRYATGIQETSDARCLTRALGEQITQSDGLRTMMITYLTSDWFRRGGL